MNIDYPFDFDNLGRTKVTNYENHISDMIEQFLFTNQGERVNRPDFGSGLLQCVFAPNSQELASALQFTIQAGLSRWLRDLIDLKKLEVTSDGAKLCVVVDYVIRLTSEHQSKTFERRFG